MPVLRWLWRGVVTIIVVGFLGWAPIFDWMSPPRVARNLEARDTERGRSPDARLVLLVSIDGLAPRVLTTTETPTLERLASQGLAASQAHSVRPSITMTSHTSMISGVSPDVHGVRFNRYQPWSRIGAPTVFTACASARLRCALFAGKRKFAHFAEFESGVDRYQWGADALAVLDHALTYLRTASPDFVMIHLAEVDLAGHDEGWGSPAQRAAIRHIDQLLGSFLERLDAVSDRPLTLIVTADHGGHGNNHAVGNADDVSIPWIAWGDGVESGGLLPSVEIADTAATVLSLLSIEIPPTWTGRPHLQSPDAD